MSARGLPPGLRARVLASRAERPAASGFGHRLAVAALVGLGWLGGAFALLGPRRDWGELPVGYALGALGLVGASAAALTALGVSRGKQMLGPPAAAVIAALCLLPLALAGFFVAATEGGPSSLTFASRAEALTSALRCHGVSLLLAAPVLGALVWLKRGLTLAAPGLLGACLGAGAGAWAHLVVHAHCAAADGVHVLSGHVLPTLPLMLLGAAAGYRALR